MTEARLVDLGPAQRCKQAMWATRLALRRLNASRRALPYFLIIGAQKGGTTSLYNDLVQHPQVAGALRKELHYFDINNHRSVNWYRAHFPILGRSTRITGEASPYYLFHPYASVRIKDLLPDVKLIVMLRNPIDRAWSHYHHEITRGFEKLSFEQAIEAESRRVGDPSTIGADSNSDAACHHRHFSYLARGRYAQQLRRWFEFFPREQMLVLKSEEYFEDPATTYCQLLEFLGLDGLQPVRRRWLKQGGYNNRIDGRLRSKLADYFSAYNSDLYHLLGRDLAWTD